MGLGTVIYVLQSRQAEQAARPTPTVFVPTSTPSATVTPSATYSPTPLPTPTGTSVVSNDVQEASNTELAPAQQPETTTEGTVTPVEGQAPTEESGSSEAQPTAEPTEEIQLATEEPTTDATSTSTLVLQTPTEEATTTPTAPPVVQVPQSGGVLSTHSNLLVWVGVILLLLLVLGVINYLRSTSKTT